MSAKAQRYSLWACLMASGISAVLLGFPLLTGDFFSGFDHTRSTLGVLCAIKQALASGEQLWLSPYMGNGGPLLARPTAQLFYPIRWLMVLWPSEWAASLEPLIHIVIGAGTTTWLARTFGIRKFTAVCAGLTFAFSGTVLNLILHSNYVVAAAWLPLVWASCRRALHPRGRRFLLVVVAAGLIALLLGGEPQAFCLACAICLLEILRRLWRHRAQLKTGLWRRQLGKKSILLLALLPATFAVGLLQWAPFFAEATLSKRSATLNADDALTWSFQPSGWVAALWPNPTFGMEPTENLWQLLLSTSQDSEWNSSPYVGLLFICALVCGVGLRRARPAVLVFTVGLIFALGDSTPLYPLLLKLLPPLGMFRYPQKYLLITTLAATMVVMSTLQSLPKRPKLASRFTIALGAMGIAQAGAYLFFSLGAKQLDADLLPDALHAIGLPPLHTIFKAAIVQAGATLLLALAVVVFVRQLRPYLAAFIVSDLALAALTAIFVGPPLMDLDTPLGQVQQKQNSPPMVLCVHTELMHAGFRLVKDARAWNRSAFMRVYNIPEMQACDGHSNAISYSPLRSTMTDSLAMGFYQHGSVAARALGCTHIVKVSDPGAGTSLVAYDYPAKVLAVLNQGPRVYQVVDPIPLGFVIRNPSYQASEDKTLQALGRSRTAAEAIAVVDDPAHRLGKTTDLPSGHNATATQTHWNSRADVILHLEGSGSAVVGLRTTFQVGWSAHQGPRELKVIRSSGQHVAAIVDDVRSGPIHFTYNSPYFGSSLLLASLGLAAIILGAILFPSRVRRRSTA